MPNRPSPWLARIRELLADGEWHDRDQLIRDAMRLVPPGKATREGERARRRMNGGRVQPRTRGDAETSSRTGARSITVKSLWKLVDCGEVKRDGDRIRKAVR